MRRAPMRLLSSVVLSSVLITPCLAAKLPDDAKPLSESEIKNMYSGKTGVYKVSDVYYSPTGTVKGVFGKPKPKSTFSGTWEVSGNEICMKNKGRDDSKIYTDCNKIWRSGNKIYELWTVHYDGTKPNGKDDYSTDVMHQLKAGDLVSKQYEKMGGM
jgi:hypothetical protein